MQIINNVIFFCAFLIFLQNSACQKNNNNYSIQSNKKITIVNQTDSSTKQTDYKLLTKDCFDQSICLAYIYIKKDLFDRKNLIELSNLLNNKNKEKERLRIFFFDNLSLAQAHSEGKKELQDLENDARALFLYTDLEESLKLRILNKESENWSSWETVFSKEIEDKNIPPR